MYPNPYYIVGNRMFLEQSYKNQVNTLATKDHNKQLMTKDPNIFRFCSYNVKYFNFKKNANKLIFDFIKDYKLTAFSLIEYHILEDEYLKNIGDWVLFEQLKYYGISTYFNLDNKDYDYTMTCEIQNIKGLDSVPTYISNEKRGFTHLQVKIYPTTLNIITIHLDVVDEQGFSRLHEIQEIYTYITFLHLNNVIIIGDFNEWDIQHNEPLYEPSLMEFQERTGFEHFSTQAHDFLKSHNFINIFDLLDKYPKFSCWSSKLVDFCYKYKPTWNEVLKIKNIDFIYIDYSDHLPIILDIEI